MGICSSGNALPDAAEAPPWQHWCSPQKNGSRSMVSHRPQCCSSSSGLSSLHVGQELGTGSLQGPLELSNGYNACILVGTRPTGFCKDA
eukprot:scaffold277949_cov19-Tisochrysis_lutea.AAC.1